MAMAAHTKPIDMVEVRPANEDKNIAACTIQTTQWTPCSKTCGWGFSERITNNNDACELVKEFMLCEMRKCGASPKKRNSTGSKISEISWKSIFQIKTSIAMSNQKKSPNQNSKIIEKDKTPI